MDIKTYRAKSLQDALSLVRSELGPDAAVLHTREVGRGGLRRLFGGGKTVEVTASAAVHVPSRLPERMREEETPAPSRSLSPPIERFEPPRDKAPPVHLDHDYRAKFRDDLKDQLSDLHSMVEDLCDRSASSPQHELPESLFHIFTDMIEADVSEEVARELLDQVRDTLQGAELNDPLVVKSRLVDLVERQINVTGPIQTASGRRVVALVGPTGVGKTTTIAKLAANYRLREKIKVGLITVDTYRIAAVEQLRTYADIIDLPMEIVSTPREMRDARQRLADMDLILLDTAGRSPRDEVRVHELRSMLVEAQADEVHLVLSAVTSPSILSMTATKFREVGVTSLLMTKLDEALGLGNILPLLRNSRLPLSYLTDGQNVPDDIRCADSRRLAREILGIEDEENKSVA